MADRRIGDDRSHGGNYLHFMAMVGTSTAMMFGLMYLNTYSDDHLFWSETRFWMALVMGAAMGAVMLLFMWSMYRDRTKNFGILGVFLAVFAVALWLMRSQQTIDDVDYMRAMIPHHSIAIMTSERARIHDPRTRALADDIIEAQRREIAEMKKLIADIEANGVRGLRTDRSVAEKEAPVAAMVVPVGQAVP